MTFFDYDVKKKPAEDNATVSNDVALSMQERLNARLMNTAPQAPQAPMAQPAQSDGFGRTV